MWGMAHGPVTGRLLAEQITSGKQPEALAEFDRCAGLATRRPNTRTADRRETLNPGPAIPPINKEGHQRQ
jgi:hypothetical protein